MVTEKKVMVVCCHFKLITEFLFAFLINDILSCSSLAPQVKKIVLEKFPFNFRLTNQGPFTKFSLFFSRPCRGSFFYFFLINLYWSIIAWQYFVSFCCTTKQSTHMHTHVPISPPPWASLTSSLSHPLRSSQSTGRISLCYAAASHEPTILHSVVYIPRCYAHFVPASPSHPMSSSPFSISTSLFLPCN